MPLRHPERPAARIVSQTVPGCGHPPRQKIPTAVLPEHHCRNTGHRPASFWPGRSLSPLSLLTARSIFHTIYGQVLWPVLPPCRREAGTYRRSSGLRLPRCRLFRPSPPAWKTTFYATPAPAPTPVLGTAHQERDSNTDLSGPQQLLCFLFLRLPHTNKPPWPDPVLYNSPQNNNHQDCTVPPHAPLQPVPSRSQQLL